MHLSSKESFSEIRKYLWWSVIGSIIIGLVMIACIGVYLAVKTKANFFSSFGSGVLIAGGSLLAGGFLGFIFGIPSILQDPKARVKYNDNLVQISDWLTKVIVGVGLTQLYHIPNYVIRIGEKFRINFGENEWGRNVSISIIGYFFILGFFMLYFWTKTDYSTVMKVMDDDFNSLEVVESKLMDVTKEKEQALQEKAQAILEKKEMVSDITIKETKDRITNSETSSSSAKIGELVSTGADKDDIEKLKNIVESTLPKKPVTVKDDIQKYRWGGLPENNGKRMSAKVSKNTWQNLFDVDILIANTDNMPVDVPAAVFIHDSYEFPNNVIYTTPVNGIIKISILAYEAFTLGALFADGTELELDLNTVSGYPSDFYVSPEKTDKA